jgi:N-acyl-D-aspartate/D-glutamate deacylase
MHFDLLLRGGTLIDGTGTPGRPADIGVMGHRIVAVGDLSAVAEADVAQVIDCTGHVVAPGFVDPHGHSDMSVLVDGALCSLLLQGWTTQLMGNCGDTIAPLTPAAKAFLAPMLAGHGVEPTWTSFAGYLEAVEAQPLGINVAPLVGQGTIRAAVMGATDRRPTGDEQRSMEREVELAMDAGAIGLSTGLIYPPGIHAGAQEIARLVAVAFRHGGLYATHMRNEADEVAEAIDEALETAREGARLAGTPARLQISHLKAASLKVFGQGTALVDQIARARDAGLDAAADQYPYTAAHTTLATVLPPDILALDLDAALAALRDPSTRARIRRGQAEGISGWENVALDPGWDGVAIAYCPSRPQWNGRTMAEIGADEGGDPADLAMDALADDRLAVDCVLHCMDPDDVAAIMAVPWIAVCTDAEARRPGHPILGRGVPHPRAYGSTARVLGQYVRETGALSLETAVAKLSSVPAARLGLRDRGVLREGWAADLVVFDPATVRDLATFEHPAVHPAGIRDVIVNGGVAVRDGRETGTRAGRLLRRGD